MTVRRKNRNHFVPGMLLFLLLSVSLVFRRPRNVYTDDLFDFQYDFNSNKS